MAEKDSIMCIYIYITFVYSSVVGHIDCFCILIIINAVAVLNVDMYKRIKVSKVVKRQLLGLVAFYSIFSSIHFQTLLGA